MLLRSQLEKLSQTLTNGNVGHAEKLYLQDIILRSIYQHTAKEIVFKGGTALLKLYSLDRFSEDIDFTAAESSDLPRLLRNIMRDLENFGARAEESKKKENEISFSALLGIRGPTYNGNRISLSFVRVEINKKAQAEHTAVKHYIPLFPDIPAFEIVALTEEEILAEKLRALLTRDRARDLYDINHLLNKGVEIMPKLVEKKLEYYNLAFSVERVEKEAEKKRKSWQDLKTLVYSPLPEFSEVLDLLRTKLEGINDPS